MLLVCTAFGLASLLTLTCVAHPGARLLIVALLGTIAYQAWARMAVHTADNYADRRRRARRTAATLLVACILPGCERATVTPEPAEIASLDCGARACSITTAGSSALIWIQE